MPACRDSATAARALWTATCPRRTLCARLRATGYQPEPGTEGTIQDLNSDARQRLILDTNVAMVRERAYRDSMLGSLAYPAQRLVRIRYSRQPRDWDAR